MNTLAATELSRFRDFVNQQLHNGMELTPEEALALWRAHFSSAAELAASVAKIKQVIADIEGGDEGRPTEDVFADLRNKYNISS